MDPPAYQTQSTPLPENHSELPNYVNSFQDASVHLSHAPRLSNHVYGIRKRMNSPEWLILRVTSRSNSSDKLPLCVEGDPVVGSVELNLEQETVVKAVTVTMTGDLIADSTQTTFFTVSQVLWSPERGHPHGCDANDEERRKDKLRGQFSWSFALEIPSKVHLMYKKALHTYSPPASFLERGARVTVVYRLLVTIGRGKLQPPSSVDTVLQYVPRIRPAPPSALRQLAYREQMPLSEPNDDPNGWHPLQHVLFEGSMFNSRELSVKCHLSLAKPVSVPERAKICRGIDESFNKLCYTRGSTIPLFLKLESSNAEALDLLLAQKAVTVQLQRILVLVHEGMLAPGRRMQPPRTETTCGSAVWWPSPHADSTVRPMSARALQGEIVLGKSLAPTAHLGRFEIHYKVVLLPFKATGFTSQHPANVSLQEIPVVIGTTHTHGPRPISYSSAIPSQ